MKQRSCYCANILGRKEADNGNSEKTDSQNRIIFRSLQSVLSGGHSWQLPVTSCSTVTKTEKLIFILIFTTARSALREITLQKQENWDHIAGLAEFPTSLRWGLPCVHFIAELALVQNSARLKADMLFGFLRGSSCVGTREAASHPALRVP